MAEERLIGLACIIGLGIAAQWIAWRLRWPSILLLLLTGFVAGPVMKLYAPAFSLDPDFIFGGLLFPFVSLAVAIILFEGGLTLRLDELPKAGGVMWRLVTIGALATFLIVGAAAHYILDFGWQLAFLLSSILVVTGPTVIAPLLNHIRLQGTSGAILKWEGIVIDPIGATLTVLLYEVVIAGKFHAAPAHIITGVLSTVISGAGAGLLGAIFLMFALRRHLIPDDLQNGVALAVVVCTFAAANHVQAESGLLAVVVMGVALANQKWIHVHHIVEFKENLRVMLLSGLFILLSARLSLSDLTGTGYTTLLFLLVLIFVARPISVALATWRSKLKNSEKLFLAWMAPRGIVAASIASIFSLRLQEHGIEGAERLAPITVIVIVGTVLVYGLTTPPLARRLSLTKPAPRGLLIAGAHDWAREIAHALLKCGQTVRLVDTRRELIEIAREEGLAATHASIQSRSIIDAADREGLGILLCLTSNDEVNTLACMRYMTIFGRARVFQLTPHAIGHRRRQSVGEHQSGRFLFGDEASYQWIEEQWQSGASISIIQTNADFSLDEFSEEQRCRLMPLFFISEGGDLTVVGAEETPAVRAPSTIIALSQPMNGDDV